jgi:uncharacterized coiled-coil protein SlyX
MDNRSEQEIMDGINAILDRVEARMDRMNEKLDRIVEELDKHDKNKSRKRNTITTTYDGEIMYRYKNNNDEKINK